MPLGAARFGLGGISDFGKLEHIITQTATGLTTPNYIDFTSIDESTYNVHFFTYTAKTTNSQAMYLQFRESGTWETASVYQYALQRGSTGGAFAEEKSTAQSYILLGNSKADAGGTLVQGYVYLYNLGDSSKYSFTTQHQMREDFFRFGSGVLEQASAVDGIRFGKQGSTSFDILGASLYGIAES